MDVLIPLKADLFAEFKFCYLCSYPLSHLLAEAYLLSPQRWETGGARGGGTPLRLPNPKLPRRLLSPLYHALCRLFGTTGNCAACSKLIPAFEMVMRARDNVYHLDCFACQLCNQR